MTRDLMTSGRSLTLLAVGFTLLFAGEAKATPPVPSGAPQDPAAIGDAFVEAWLVFRSDLDTLSHGHLNPHLLEAWFDQAPPFLVRDAARLATSPGVLLCAVSRIAKDGEKEDYPLLEQIQEAHRGTPFEYALRGARIAAGDMTARKSALEQITDHNLDRKIEGARALAAAGDPRGFSVLRDMLISVPHLSNLAARTLGRFGSSRDERALENAIRSGHHPDAALSALGEIRLRKSFPAHHLMLTRRDPLGQRFNNAESLYGAWLEALMKAIGSGAEVSSGILASLEEQRKDTPKGDEGEVARRQLKSLMDFWEMVDSTLSTTSARPIWPTTYTAAMENLAAPRPSQITPPELATRVSSAISICAWGSARLDHDAAFAPGRPFSAVTPGGDRVDDLSLSTSWRGIEGARIVVDLDTPGPISSVSIAQSCPRAERGKIISVKVTGTGPDGRWEEVKKLRSDTRYFQRIETKKRIAARLEIELSSIEGNRPACIGELRIR